MISNHTYPYRQPSPEEIQALMRQAHVERAQAVRNLFAAFLALFRRSPAAEKGETQSALSAAACR